MSHNYETMGLEEIKKLYDAIKDASFDNPHEQTKFFRLRCFLDALTRLKELEIEIEIAKKEVAEANVLIEQDNPN